MLLCETVIYAISAFVAAVAGCCYVILTQYCSNAQFDVVFIIVVIWAAIGGRGSLLWAMMGAFIVQGAQSYLGDEFLNVVADPRILLHYCCSFSSKWSCKYFWALMEQCRQRCSSLWVAKRHHNIKLWKTKCQSYLK